MERQLAELATFQELMSQYEEGALKEHSTLRVDLLDLLKSKAIDLAKQNKNGHPLPRLARLYLKAGAPNVALALLEIANEIAPQNEQAGLARANILAEFSQIDAALEVLKPFADVHWATPQVLCRVADFYVQRGEAKSALPYYQAAALKDPNRQIWYLRNLISTGEAKTALMEARVTLHRDNCDPPLLFVCLQAISKFSPRSSEIERSRAEIIAALRTHNDGPLWVSRVFRSEQRTADAIYELEEGLAARPGDEGLIRERASLALQEGYFGRDASHLLAAQSIAMPDDLAKGIQAAEFLFQEKGVSLKDAASCSDIWSNVRTPESVFEVVAEKTHKPRQTKKTTLAILAHSLAAGGAERIVAMLYGALKESNDFDSVRLYLMNLSSKDKSDFYLPLTNADPSEICVIPRAVETQGYFSILRESRYSAQSVYDQLVVDKPDILHVSLEPLTIYAAFAGVLAGVPKILMHTHNMRPTTLHADSPNPPRWASCYRSLLARDEIKLLTCAEAATKDYLDWLCLPDSGKVRTVYNGHNFDRFERPSDFAKSQARIRLGIAADRDLVGTAFKFRGEKRPHLWVTAAAEICKENERAHFIMFGDGELLSSTKDFVAKLGLRRRFTFPGLVKDMHFYMHALDVFMLCSSTEALPNVLIEAQACGVPVVTNIVGGVAETMIENVSGVLVSGDSPEALARAVSKILESRDWRSRARKAGSDFVRGRFGGNTMIENMKTIFLS